MMKANSSWLKRTLAMLLVVVTLVGLLPASVIADAVESWKSNSYIPGDVNGDGEVNALDVNLLRRYIVGGYEVTINLLAADVNADGQINAQDVNNIRRYIAGGYGIELKPGLVPTYSVKFYDGDRLIDTLTAEQDQPLGAVPAVEKSSKANAILLGYFIDPECTQPFYAENPVTGDMNVYAKYQDMESNEELNFTSFAQMDQQPDISFEVLGVGDPAEAITLEVKDGSDPVALQFEEIPGGYIVSAAEGFKKGASYQLHLADGWTFKDKPDTIRTASFSIEKEQVENLQMSGDIIYIQDTEDMKYNLGGRICDVLTSKLISEQGGSFTYESAAQLKVGDMLCIYADKHPEERNKGADALLPVVYVKVAGINGDTVTFAQLSIDDQLALYEVPDNLPMLVPSMPETDTGTINISQLDVEMYTFMMGDGYDLAKAKSVIGVGDFISLYVSQESIQTETDVYYGKVTAYNSQTGEITYKKTTRQAILECMDLYADVDVAGDDLITEAEKAEMEAIILGQIQESGFAEEVAFALADLVTKTDGFNSAALESMLITDGQGNVISPEELQLMNIGSCFELTDDVKLTVEIITKGEQLHFNKGIQIAVGVEAEFEVELDDGDKICINLKATFVQEVVVSPRVKGFVIFKLVFLIPVPVGADVGGTIDIKNFTAFSFEAEIFTVAEEDKSIWEQFQDVVKNPEKLANIPGLPAELSKGLETVGDVFDKIAELENNLAKAKDKAEQYQDYMEDLDTLWAYVEANGLTTREDWAGMCDALGKTSITSDLLDMMNITAETGLKTEYYESLEALMERYCEMVEKETDWITLLEKDIFDHDVCVFGIAIGVDVDFVVRADLSLAIGSNLQYEVGKRYEFWFKLAPFYHKAGCTSMDLIDERFAFQFYVMGRLGLKAGIRAKLEFGIGSCKLANVGVSTELGPYFKLWGFFVYEHEKYRAANTDEWHSEERMAGALLMEFGLYFKMAFEAEALGGLFSYEYEFLDEEIPILTNGKEHFYYQPDYEPAEDEFVRIQDEDGNSQNGITMILPDYTLALDYLDLRGGYMAIESLDYDQYVYTVSNPNFAIDPETGIISVTVPEGTRYMECDLTVTYKYSKMAFSTYDMTVTVPLVWTNLADTELSEYYTASVRVGNDADGYTTVWSKRVLKNSEFDLPTVDEIKKIIGWNEYKYDMGTGYGSQQTEGLTLIEDEVYDFNIDYDIYTMIVTGVENGTGTATFYAGYGEAFDFSALKATGTTDYTNGVFTTYQDLFVHETIDLNKAIDSRMAAALLNGVTASANYMDNSVTATFMFTGIDADAVTIKLRRGDIPDLATIEALAADYGMAIKDISPMITQITASTMYQVICGELDTPPATITFVENGGSAVADITKPYGSLIGVLPSTSKAGHTFAGWYVDEALTQIFEGTKMPEGGMTLYAKWTANEYTVNFHVNGGNAMENNKLSVTYGAAYGELPKPERTGYGFIGWFTAAEGGQQITAQSIYAVDGDQTLYAQWRELKEISADIFDFGDTEIFVYQKDTYVQADYFFSQPMDDSHSLQDFTFEYICEGYENEGYVDKPMKVGTWGVKVTRPADDTYAKFEAFYPGVLIINKGTRNILDIAVSQLGHGLTYIDVKLSSTIDDLDENATIQYALCEWTGKVYAPFSTSAAVRYNESARIFSLSYGASYQYLQVVVDNDRNYEAASVVLRECDYQTAAAPTTAWTDHADTSWYNTTDTAFVITTPEQLAGLAKLVNSGTDAFRGKTIKLDADIDMRAFSWVPIGTSSKPFSGSFDGQGHTVSGMYYNNSSAANVGMFGYVYGYWLEEHTICNVVVDDSWFYGKHRVGAIVGNGCDYDIDHCVNYATVRAYQLGLGDSYQSCAGGIAGYIVRVSILHCINYGTVYSEGRLTGGIAGYADGGNRVMSNVNFGSVTGSSRVGGIVGCTEEYDYVENNYNVGNVRPNDGNNDYIGAIVGRNVSDDGIVRYNYYLNGCAKGGNGKNRYAVGKDGGSVTDGDKNYYASSFTTPNSVLSSSAGTYGKGRVLLDALNNWVTEENDSWTFELVYWEAIEKGSYPMPIGTHTSALRK